MTNSRHIHEQQQEIIASETEIIAALQRDISGAFEVLDRTYRPLLFSLAMREMKDRDDAEECVQTTFLRAFRYLKKISQHHPSHLATLHPKAWLCRILHNVMKDAHAIAWGHKAVSLSPYNIDDLVEEAYSEDSERALLRQETAKQLQALLQHLSPIQQHVIVLRFVYNLKFAEIGERLHIPEGTARSHGSRAISRLQGYIHQQSLSDGSFLEPGDCRYWEKTHPRPFRAADTWLSSEEMKWEADELA